MGLQSNYTHIIWSYVGNDTQDQEFIATEGNPEDIEAQLKETRRAISDLESLRGSETTAYGYARDNELLSQQILALQRAVQDLQDQQGAMMQVVINVPPPLYAETNSS